MSDGAVSFIRAALRKDAQQRATVKDLLHHPWMRSFLVGQPAATPKDVRLRFIRSKTTTLNLTESQLDGSETSYGMTYGNENEEEYYGGGGGGGGSGGGGNGGGHDKSLNDRGPSRGNRHYCTASQKVSIVVALPTATTNLMQVPEAD